MKPADQRRFDALIDWSRRHGGQLHPSLEVYHDNASGFALRVKPSAGDGLEPGFIAVACPLSTTLSYLNALVDGPLGLSSSPGSHPQQAAFPPRFMRSVPPYVVGRFFLVREYLKGPASFWWPYIATLPQPEHVGAWALPAFWPDDDAAYLDGTNAHVAVEEIQANVRREFKQARRALKDDGFPGWQDYTQMLYKWAFCIFTSRSFRPSLVLSEPAKHHVSRHMLADGPVQCRLDDFSVLQPLFDVANHSMTARHAWDAATDPAGCRLVCRDAYPPGAQVYNNYGPKTNSELLLGYGFILPDTDAVHNDYVHVRKRQHQSQTPPEPEVAAEGDHPDDQGRQDDGAGDNAPRDFLISLRPVSHPSSLAARARLPAVPSRLSRLPCFAHFEPALVDDLAAALASAAAPAATTSSSYDNSGSTPTANEKALLDRWNRQLPGGSGIADAPGILDTEDGGEHDEHDAQGEIPLEVPPALEDLVERVKAALAGKLRYDYNRLVAAAGGGGGGGGEGDAAYGDGEENAEAEGSEEERGTTTELPPPANANQRLAAEYRARCARVLVAALEGLMEGPAVAG